MSEEVKQGDGQTDNSTLLCCPCGQTPGMLHISGHDQGDKWMTCMGDCCGTWEIEFRAQYLPVDSPELYASAVEAWNDAPRST
jgi:hypothetical protein